MKERGWYLDPESWVVLVTAESESIIKAVIILWSKQADLSVQWSLMVAGSLRRKFPSALAPRVKSPLEKWMKDQKI